jgi:hypothetical protein
MQERTIGRAVPGTVGAGVAGLVLGRDPSRYRLAYDEDARVGSSNGP